MSKHCPLYGCTVLYIDCLECDNKVCKKEKQKNKIVIGIDQSYKDTGITVSLNNKVMNVSECFTEYAVNNSVKRGMLKETLTNIFKFCYAKSQQLNASVIVIIERIRLRSQGFISIDYITSIGALNALIVDLSHLYNFPVYSVDTRAWKSSIVGNSKGKSNKYGIDEKKYPTILWCIKNGYEEYIINYDVGKKKKGVIEKNGKRFTYNDNKADSICISLYGFIPESYQLLKEEH